ncbi:uncharacterized protein MELLADRAFT_59065 [Melampsora larici-populina 98AG31]|uniref:Uncharacterized protein n=1 Tax=Melampsora larici-populina (strain 98AG31 / pathotype 3-4-7) TaxID=747676 RepID=F4R6Y4_MELLP|nr:uncharacterized protein MELLADRAFT_59065 [Melampsora larici-populina 98AG31]EGG11953.1 hypothetical protein MELLADRAFT_59065 [Melampsora larici-populina 98AG31]
MPIPISYTAVLSAILRTTGDPVRVHPGEDALSHHMTPTNLVLKDGEGEPLSVSVESLSLSMENDLLCRDRTVHLSGPFGVNPVSREAFIKHSPLTQSEICSAAPDPKEIAGKATISGIGKVVNVSLTLVDNLTDEEEQWHLTVDAEHKIFDPKVIFMLCPSLSPPLVVIEWSLLTWLLLSLHLT